MKKKIAVYANGWNRDSLFSAIEGIKRYGKNKDFDVFVYMSHAVYGSNPMVNECELNIYRLGDIAEYDGAIVFSAMLNVPGAAAEICREALRNHVPVVSVGEEIEGVPYVATDNESGMRELVEHLIREHQIKRAVFIGGAPDHVDSIARLRTTQEVLKEHGLELKESDIYYANWGYEPTVAIVDQLIESEEGLPDALICANDYMALAAQTELTVKGYRLPEDVAITGFDHVQEGRIMYPALTTVDLSYEEIGYRCCELIYESADQGEGDGQKPPKIVIPSRLVAAESCGCCESKHYDEARKKYCAYSYQTHIQSGILDQMQRTIQLYYILGANNYDTLKRNLQNGYSHNHLFEGPNFCMILVRHYFEEIMADESEFRKKTVIEGLDVAVSLKDGVSYDYQEEVTRQRPVPGCDKEEGVQRIYYFMPLHADGYNYGYLVFQDDSMLIRNEVLHSYLERLKEVIKSLRINLRLDAVNRKLTQLYDKDPMTGLFNRFGYENRALPLYEHCQNNHTSMMVMFVDINYMKRINDVYGHIHGDNAIRIVADSIKENLKPDWMAVRFGGDEFLIIGPDCDQLEAEEVKQDILDYLDRKNADGTRHYRISASCGYVLTDPDQDLILQDYIKKADDVMYEIKRRVHAKDNQ